MTKLQKKIEVANHPEEMLYLVDEDNQEIGSVIRKAANSDPKFIHREVGVIVFNEDRELLLQKRSLNKTVHPGMWSITAGHITYGRKPIQAAREELFEELGLKLELIYFTTRLNTYSHERHFMYYFLCFYQEQKITIQKEEVERVDFFSPQTLKQLRKGEKVNKTHQPVFEMYWQGKLKKYEDELRKID
jgi:isopentenyldiphosphate isomerase